MNVKLQSVPEAQRFFMPYHHLDDEERKEKVRELGVNGLDFKISLMNLKIQKSIGILKSGDVLEFKYLSNIDGSSIFIWKKENDQKWRGSAVFDPTNENKCIILRNLNYYVYLRSLDFEKLKSYTRKANLIA